MRNIFTLLCKLITVTINRNSFLQENNQSAEKMEPVEPGGESFIPVINSSKKLTSFSIKKLFRPLSMMGLLHGRWSATQTKPEEYGINLPQHLSPVAVMQPVSIYNNTTSTTTQTNRMKQVLLAAKRNTLCFVVLLMSVFAAQKSSAQLITSGTWPLTSDEVPTIVGPAVAGSQLFGSGLSNSGYGTTGATAGSWTNSNETNAVNGNDYIQFTISPSGGNTLTITTISTDYSVSTNQASMSARIKYSLNNFSSSTDAGASITGINNTTPTNVSRTVSITVASGQTLTVRIYAWGNSQTSTAFRVRNFIISGTSNIVSPLIFSGSGDFPVPVGVSCMQVEAWGGGGAGGGVNGSNSTRSAGGGAGGAYVKKIITIPAGTNSIAYSVGAGGTGVSSGNGNAGGNTTFGSVTAPGGAGGGVASGGNGSGAGQTTGTDVIYIGGAGFAGASGRSGGGGGGAGSAEDGHDATATGGGSGGSGGGGNGAAGRTSSGDGTNAVALSGGGSGAYSTSNNDRTGGNGFRGQIIISWGGTLQSSDAPIITYPLCAGSLFVSGTTTEAIGTTINVFSGTTKIGTTSVVSAGIWSAPVTALVAGTSITATAQATGECTSSLSDAIIVSAITITGPSAGTQTVCQNGIPVDLSVSATASSGTVTNYQWYSNTSPAITGANVTLVSSGATATTYTPSTAVIGTLYYFCTVTGSNGCSATSSVSGAIKVPPVVGTPTAITGNPPTCQLVNAGTTTTFSTIATDNTGFNWTISNPAAGSIDPTSGVMTWANGFFGSVDIQVTANGCSGPSAQTIRTIVIVPTVGTPDPITIISGSDPLCQLTNGTTTTTYTTSATNNTGFNWSLSNASAGSINSSGIMTWSNNFFGTVDIRVTANGCNGPSAQVIHTVAISQRPVPTLTTVPPTNICLGTPIIYTTESGKSNYTWIVAGTVHIDYEISAGGTGTTDNTVTIQWLTVGSKTVTVNYSDPVSGCNGANPASDTKVISSGGGPDVNSAVVGSVNPEVCTGSQIQLTASATGASDYAWTGPNGFTSTAQNPVIASATTLMSGDYFVTISNGCGQLAPIKTTIVVDPVSVGGTTTAVTQAICSGTMPIDITLGGNVGNVIRWEKSTTPGFNAGTVTTISNTSTTLAGATIGTLTVQTYFRAVVQSGVCVATANSSVAVVTINNLPTVTNSTGASTCVSGSLSISATASGGATIDWYDAATNGTLVGTGTTFVTPVITATTIYYAQARNTTTSCISAARTAVTATISPALAGGAVTASTGSDVLTNCGSINPSSFISTSDASGGNGTFAYQWQSSTDNITFTDISFQTGNTYNPNTLNVTTYFRRRVTSNNGNCTAFSNTITVAISQTPTNANAGSAQTICNTTSSVTLTGNNPTVGTGSWSIVSGPSNLLTQFNSTTDRNAIFTPAGGAGAYVLQWAISNGPCTPSTSNVTITVNAPPSVANAGIDQNVCGTSATLAADVPTSGTGAWSIISGTGGSITTPSSATSAFTGVIGSPYTLRWTVSNSPCNPSTADDVVITFKTVPTVNSITSPAAYCGGAQAAGFTFASTPAGATYTWTSTADVGFAGGLSGSGNIAAFIAKNDNIATNATVTATVSVTGTLNGCPSPAQKFTVTVNPKLNITLRANNTTNTTVCSDNNTVNLSTSTTGGNTTLFATASAAPNASLVGISGSSTQFVKSDVIISAPATALIDNTTTIHVTLNIPHTSSQDLDLYLVGPDNRAMLLSNDDPRPYFPSVANFYTNLTLSSNSDATTMVNSNSLTAPYGNFYHMVAPNATTNSVTVAPDLTGAANGQGGNGNSSPTYGGIIPTAALVGGHINGTWSLYVFDDYGLGGTTGTLSDWSLSIGYPGALTTTIYEKNSDNTLTAVTSTVNPGAGIHTYVATVSDAASCSATSSEVTVTVAQAATISSQPTALQTICEGLGASFSVTGDSHNGSSLSYQWYKDGTPIDGATLSTYSIAAVATGDAGTYTVTVSNTCGSPATSTDAVLVVSQAATISSQPTALQTICEGLGASFSVTGDSHNGSSLSYQWYKDGTPIDGATLSTYSIAAVATGDAGTYTVTVSNTCGSPATSTDAVLVVSQAATISSQPTALQTICEGLGASFSVTGDSHNGSSLSYQWYKDGTPIDGATLSTYSIAAVATGDAGTYTVTVSNTCGSPATSTDAVLVVSQAATISSQPTALQTICEGLGASFSVTGDSHNGSSLSYQWYKDGTPIDGATLSTYSIAAVATGDAGTYTVTVSNTCGSPATSTDAVLVVSQAATISSQPTALQTICEGLGASFSVTGDSHNGSSLSYQWYKDGTPIDGATLSTYSIAAVATGDAGTYTVTVSNTCGSPATSTDAVLVVSQAATISSQPTALQTICEGLGASFSVTGDSHNGSSLSYQWYKDGTPIDGATLSTYSIAAVATGDAGTYTVTVSNTCGSPATSTDAVLVVSQAATISSQPTALQTICEGLGASFSVTGDSHNGSSLSYQWYKDGTPIDGATLSTYSIAAVATGDAGTYTVTVSNTCGSPATSTDAVLVVSQAATISSQPTALQTICEGLGASFSVTGDSHNGSSLSYQWYKDGTPIDGATLSTYSIAAVATGDAGTYTVTVSNTCGSPATSTDAVLVVSQAATISSQPTALQTICEGLGASFSVTGDSHNGSSLSYQWYKDGTPIDGATLSTYSIAAVATGDAGTYTVTVSNTCGSPATSTDAVLVVSQAATISSQPTALQTICEGLGASFSVTGDSHNGSSLSYQWYKDGTPIDGATLSTYSIAAVATGDAGTYTVTVSNTCGSPATSTDAVLVVSQAATISSQPTALQTICEGLGASFSVTGDSHNGSSLSYQWYKDGTPIDGATLSTYSIAAVATGDAGTYTVTVSNTCGSPATSTDAVLVVSQAATISSQPTALQTICEGLGASFSVTGDSHNGSSLSYQWYKDGTPIDGATLSTYSIAAVATGDAGTYTVTVSNTCGSPATSTDAVLVVSQAATISSQPTALQTICEGLGASFSVTGDSHNGSSLSYQWYKDGTPIDGATLSTYSIAAVATGDAGTYTVTVSNTCGSPATSTDAVLVVSQAATISSQPTALQTICEGLGASFSVTGDSHNGSSLSYQWYKDGTPIDGATLSTYSIAAVATGDAGTYTVTVSNTCGSPATSTDAVLVVNALPNVIAGDYGNVCENGGTITLAGSPSGGTWTGTGVSGNSFNPSGLAAGDYTLVYSYTNANNCTKTDQTIIHVNAKPIVTMTLLNATYCKNAGAVILSGSPATGAFTIDGASATSFDPSILAVGPHTIIYTYTDGTTGCTNTASQTVSITALPTAAISYAGSPFCPTSTPSVSVTRTGQTGGTYTGDDDLVIDVTTGAINLATSSAGDHTITYTFSANGCSNSTTANISIYPVATELEHLAPKKVDAGDDCSATIDDLTPPVGNSMNCHVLATGYRLDAQGHRTSTPLNSPFPVGTTIVEWVAIVNGHELSVDQEVIVTDRTAPKPDITNLPTITGLCSATATVPTATDNCAGIVSGTLISGQISYNVPNTYTITWSYSDGHGNTTTQNQTLVVIGLQQISVSSSGSACTGGVTIGLPASQSGVSYQLLRNSGSGNVSVGAPIPGNNGDAIEFGTTFTTPGTYSVRATSIAEGCSSIMPGGVTVTSGSLPLVYSVSSFGSVCTNNLRIVLSNSDEGVSYKLVRSIGGFNFLAITVAGTGFSLDFGTFTDAGTYTVVATSAGGCKSNMSGSVIVSSNTLPTQYNVTTSGSACAGGVSVGLDGSESDVTYQLKSGSTNIGGPVNGTGSAISFGLQAPGSYSVVATRTGGCSNNMLGTVTVNSGAAPATFTVTGGGAYCSGPGFAIGLSGSVSGINYQLYRDGNPVEGGLLGGTNAVLNFGTFNTLGSYTVIAKNTATNCTGNMLGNALISAGALPQAEIVNITGTTILNCNTSSISVQATGGATYSWTGGNTPGLATNTFTTSGIYTVTVTSASGCTSATSINISQDITPPVAAITNNTGTSILTCNTSSISVTATGGISYTWSNGLGNNATATITSGGTYLVTVKGANGCTSTSSITVTQNTTAPTAGISNNSGTTELNCNTSSISITASGGTSYSWNGGSTPSTADNTFTQPGTYIVTVTNASGCSATASVLITLDITPPAAAITNNTGTLMLNCNTTAINVTATGGVSYSWNGGTTPTSASNSFTAAGTYTVTVKGDNGCTSTAQITITQDESVPVPAITNNTGTSVLTCNTTSISATASGGVSYLWNGGATPSAATNTFTTPGTYTVTVTGASGCTSTAQIVVTQNTTAPTAGITNNSGTTILTCNTTSISATATGGDSYSWSGGTSPLTADNTFTAPGTYIVTVKGANGCTSTAQIVVTQNTTAPTAGITNNSGTTVLTCNTTSISATATGGDSYSWSGGTSPLTADNTFNAPGTYIVTVKGANGCTSTAQIVVTQNTTAPAAGITNNSGTTVLTCNTTSISVTATGGVSYSWDGGSTPATAGNTFNAPGTYTVTVTGAGGCTSTAQITVTQNTTVPTAGITNNSGTTVLTCNTTSISVTATGGVGYSWTGGATPSAATNTFTTPGTYTVTVTGAGGCTSTTSITISQNTTAPVAAITNNTGRVVINCNTPSISVTASGGVSYAWTGGATPATAANTFTTPGTYTVTVTGDNGCTSTASITIIRNMVTPIAGITNNSGTTVLTCNAPSITVTATGGVSYVWSGGTTPSAATNTFTAPGTYTVTVTGATGCTSVATITITQAAGISAGLVSQSNISCNGQSDGSVQVVASGGSGNFTYTIDGVTINLGGTFSGLSAGAHTIVAKDVVTGCTATPVSITITQPLVITLNIINKTNILCNGNTNGSFQVDATGGTAPFTYSKDGGLTFQSINAFTNLAANTYTVVVKDSKGCTQTTLVTITQPAVVGGSVTANTGASCGLSDGSATVAGSGGTAPYRFNLDGAGFGSASASQAFAGLAGGNHSVLIQDASGCQTSVSFTTASATAPAAFAVTGGGYYCIGGAGMPVGLSNSQTGVNYQLYMGSTPMGSPMSGTGSALNFGNKTTDGTYTVVATNATVGCTTNMTGNAVITGGTVPVIAAITGNQSVCPGATTNFSDATPGGSWSSLQTGIATVNGGVVTGVSAGTATIQYSVTNTCGTTTVTRTVSVGAAPVVAAITGNQSVCPGATTSFSDATPGGSWSSLQTGIATVNGGVVTGVSAGTATILYTVTGCGSTTVTRTVTVGAVPVVAAITGNQSVCPGATTNFSDATPGGSWSSLQTGIATVNSGGVVTGVSAGTATIRYTVTGCGSTTVTRTVTVGAVPVVAAITGNQAVCAGSTTNFSDATQGGSWSSLQTGIATVNSGGVVTGISAGTATIRYTVTGCGSTTVTRTVTVNTAPTVNNTTAGSNGPICTGSTLNLTATGGTSYAWSGPNSFTSNSRTPSITNATTARSGTYSVIIRNAAGCSITRTVSVVVNAALTTGNTTVGSNGPVCAGSTLNLTASGGASYAWSGPNSFTSTVQNPSIANATTARSGTYTVVISNGGCSISRTVSVTVTAALTNTNTTVSSNSPVCAGSTMSLSAGGGTSYAWSGPNGYSSNVQNPSIASATTARSGTYTVTITSGTCSIVRTVNVTVNSGSIGGVVAINGGSSSAQVCLTSNVTLSVSGNTGGVTRWEYSTNNGQTWVTVNTTATSITYNNAMQQRLYHAIVQNGSCSPATSANALVTVGMTTTPGNVTTTNSTVCRNSNVTFTLSGNSGRVIRWEYSVNNGSWTRVTNTTNTLTYTGATQNRRYRAITAGCFGNEVPSGSSVISVINCTNTRSAVTEETVNTKETITLTADKLEVSAYPNPSDSYFNLKVKSDKKDDVEIKIYDITGKQVAQLRGAAYETYRFGQNLVAGTYIVEVRQANERVTTKVVKQ